MLYTTGQKGHHQFGVLSRIPDHLSRKKNIYCRECIDKYKDVICGIFTVLILIILHWNYTHGSKFDEFHLFTCSTSRSKHVCSLIYGCFENIVFAVFLICMYYGFFYLYFRLRYHLRSTDLLSGIDAYIIILPWLLSPVFKWHSITSLFIDSAQLFDSAFIYQYEDPMEDIPSSTSRSLLQLNLDNNGLSDGFAFNSTMNNTILIEPTPIGYTLPAYSILISAFIRTLWSFLLWNGLDHYLWSNKSLIWLFENGPNRAIISLKSEHQRMVYNLLLPHCNYVRDVTRLCVQFAEDEAPFILLEIKHSIYQSLTDSNLATSYKWFSVITALMSGYRLWYCPSVGYICAPIFAIIGIVVFIAFMLLAILEGDPTAFNCDFRMCSYHIFVAFGVLGAAVVWAFFIWWCMQKRLKILSTIQQTALTNDVSSFQYRLARTVYAL